MKYNKVSKLFKALEKGKSLVRIDRLENGYKETTLRINFKKHEFSLNETKVTDGTSGCSSNPESLEKLDIKIIKDIIRHPHSWLIEL